MQWSDLKATIKDTIWRSDLSDSTVDRYARSAIQEIIAYRKWPWLSQRRTTANFQSKEVVLPQDVGWLRAVILRNGTEPWPVTRTSLANLRATYDTDETGIARHYALDGQCLVLSATPDQPYTLEIVYDLAAKPTGDAWTNYLTENYAQAVIDLACARLAAGYLHDAEAAQRYLALYMTTRETMDSDADRRLTDDGSDHVVPDDLYHTAAFDTPYRRT